MNKIEKYLLKRVIRIWMRQIEARFSNDWNLTVKERAHYAGKHRAYEEVLEVLEGKVPIGVPKYSKKKKI